MVFAHTETLGGWSPAELLALLGVYFLVGGAINLVIQPSMQRLMEHVRLGTLDFTLTKPEDAQLLVSVQEVRIWKLVDIVLGAGDPGDRAGAAGRPRSASGRRWPSARRCWRAARSSTASG